LNLCSRIIWYGNSITRGSQADPVFTFPRLISKLYNATADVRAIDGTGLYGSAGVGSTCSDSNMVCRSAGIPIHTSTIREIFFLYGPQNGSLSSTVSHPEYAAAYKRVIDTCVAKGYPRSKITILSWVDTRTAGYASINPEITALQDSIATANSVNFVNIYAWMVANGGASLISADNIHTNTKGHSVIADAIINTRNITRRSGWQYNYGDTDIKGNLSVSGTSNFAGGANFTGDLSAGGKLTGTKTPSSTTALDIIGTETGIGRRSGIWLRHILSTDTFKFETITGNAYVNTLALRHNQNTRMSLANNGNFTILGTVSSTDLSNKFYVQGRMQVADRLTIWPAVGLNNRSVLDLRNPQFAGSSYIEQKWFAASSTDTIRFRNTILSGSESLFGLMRNANYIWMHRGDTDNITIGSNTDQGYKLGVSGSIGTSNKITIASTSNNRSVLDIRNPTFGVGSYTEQKWWVNSTTDTIRFRHIVVSGGDQHMRLIRNNDIGLVIGSNGSGVTGVSVMNGTNNPTAKLHLGAGTSAANTAPIKLTSGTNLSTPETGVIEFSSGKITFTPSTVRNDFLLIPSSQVAATASGAVSDIATTGNGSGTDVTYKRRENNVATGTTDGSGDLTITFSAAMPDATYTILITVEGTTSMEYSVHTKTTTTCKVRFYGSTTGLALAATSATVSYEAKDY